MEVGRGGQRAVAEGVTHRDTSAEEAGCGEVWVGTKVGESISEALGWEGCLRCSDLGERNLFRMSFLGVGPGGGLGANGVGAHVPSFE
jgi:hypothetical protein